MPLKIIERAEAASVLVGVIGFGLVLLGFYGAWCFALSLALMALGSARKDGGVTWILMAAGMFAFLQIRAGAAGWGMPLHTKDLQQLELLLCFGVYPSLKLQSLFFNPESLGVVDYLSAAVHWSYFLVPFLVVYAFWLTRPATAFRMVCIFLCTFFAGVGLYGLVPATPPWLASAEPGLPHVWRIMRFVGQHLDPEMYAQVYRHVGDANPTAAMPSLHMAVTYLIYLFVRETGRGARTAGMLYVLAMAWALVYLGEHYVVDLICGCALAWVVWRFLGPRLTGAERTLVVLAPREKSTPQTTL